MSYINGYTDWTVERDFLSAGKHTLQWIVSQQSDTPGEFWIDNIIFPSNSIVTDVSRPPGLPGEFQLFQNYPNPFNPSTTIAYELPKASIVQLTVYDILGRELKTLVNELKQAGRYEATFNASHLASGVYMYRLKAGSFVETKKLLLVR